MIRDLNLMQKFYDRLEVKPLIQELINYQQNNPNEKIEYGSCIEIDFKKNDINYILKMIFNKEDTLRYGGYGEIQIKNSLGNSITIDSEDTNFVDDISDRFVQFINESETVKTTI